MTRLSPLRSREHIKAEFKRKGISVREWAAAHGVSPNLVYEILRSANRSCDRGESHKIAVLLGLKRGEIVTSVKDAFN